MALKRKSRQRNHTAHLLEARVVSPRIVWWQAMHFLRKLMRCLLWAMVLFFIIWGSWIGVKRSLLENPDFLLKKIIINPNQIVSADHFLKYVGEAGAPHLMTINLKKIKTILLSNPAVKQVSISREFPNCLKVEIVERKPKGWVMGAQDQIPVARAKGAWLVDEEGYLFACGEAMWESALRLPIFYLSKSPKPLELGKQLIQDDFHHCVRLLKAAQHEDANVTESIESIYQNAPWSIQMLTKNGAEITFGLVDQEQQLKKLRLSFEHAKKNNLEIQSINLIPKRNVPVVMKRNSGAIEIENIKK